MQASTEAGQRIVCRLKIAHRSRSSQKVLSVSVILVGLIYGRICRILAAWADGVTWFGLRSIASALPTFHPSSILLPETEKTFMSRQNPFLLTSKHPTLRFFRVKIGNLSHWWKVLKRKVRMDWAVHKTPQTLHSRSGQLMCSITHAHYHSPQDLDASLFPVCIMQTMFSELTVCDGD